MCFNCIETYLGGSIRAKNLVDEGYCNVIKHTWLLDCVNNFRPLRPSDMIFCTEETQEYFDEIYDKFGDSYGSKATMESLKYSIEQVRLQGLGEQRIDPKDIA